MWVMTRFETCCNADLQSAAPIGRWWLNCSHLADCKSAIQLAASRRYGGSARHTPRRQLGCRKNLNYFWFRLIWRRGALSSVVEHFIHTEGVAGSNPAARTISEYSSGRDTPRQTATFPLCLQVFYRFSHPQVLRQAASVNDSLRLKKGRLLGRAKIQFFEPQSPAPATTCLYM